MPREQNTGADALSRAPLQKVNILSPLSLGDEEQEAYYERNYEPVWYMPLLS